MTSHKTPRTASETPPTASSAIDDPVPAEVRAVIDLFANQLAKVSFPDIDAGALRRQADELRTQAKTVAHARETLDAALETFVTRLSALTATATRAVAYARIYNVAHPDHPGLATAIAALSEVVQPAATSTSSGRRRSRGQRRAAELPDAPRATPDHERR
jgi:ClpP class serine protease